MHDATKSQLNRIEQGQKILVVETPGETTFEFGRPKDPSAVVRSVTKITTAKDNWSGKVYTVQITGGRRNTGRYGTTHVYVPVEQSQAVHEVTESVAGAELELDIKDEGTRRVVVEPGGTMRVKDWTGGVVIRETPKGRLVKIADDGELTILKDFPEEPTDAELDAKLAEPATPEEIAAADADRCGGCKGFGVVRKHGSQAGKPYRTHNGATAATANGNADECPACHGEGLIARAA